MCPPAPDCTEVVARPVTLPDDNADDVCLPAPPSDVCVQPSLTQGAIYVLWNPVR